MYTVESIILVLGGFKRPRNNKILCLKISVCDFTIS
jgi:hypothetical protein